MIVMHDAFRSLALCLCGIYVQVCVRVKVVHFYAGDSLGFLRVPAINMNVCDVCVGLFVCLCVVYNIDCNDCFRDKLWIGVIAFQCICVYTGTSILCLFVL